MPSAQATHPGLVRQNNEDCIRADDKRGIYLLADGIGGQNAGEVASALAVETVHEVVRSNIAHTAVDGYYELMVHALHTAHWEIHTKALTNPALQKMGTTLVAALVRDNQAFIVHVGDSRCYLFRDRPRADSGPEDEKNRLLRLTSDHTLGEQLLANGLSRDQITKKHFHTLSRSIGCGDPPSPDFSVVELLAGDMLLICSDGLTDMLTDAEIEAIVAQRDAGLDKLALELVAAANANGGRDNISVILVTPP